MSTDIKPNILPLVYWPDSVLRTVAQHVTNFNRDLNQLTQDMLLTMRSQLGMGLAAPQVGVSKRIFVMDIDYIEGNQPAEPLIIINPEIIAVSEQTFKWKEGCLSVPGHFETRVRPQAVKLAYQDITGKDHITKLYDLVAFAALHEYDHLEGKVFVDGSSSFKTQRIQKKMQKTIKIMRNTNGNYH